MGHQSKINKANKDMEREKVLAQPGMEVYKELQAFYKLHPKATPAVAEAVRQIREEGEMFSKALMEKFEAENAKLTAEYMQKELDYLKSYLSPEEAKADTEKKVFDTMMKQGVDEWDKTSEAILAGKLPRKEGVFKRFVKSVMP